MQQKSSGGQVSTALQSLLRACLVTLNAHTVPAGVPGISAPLEILCLTSQSTYGHGCCRDTLGDVPTGVSKSSCTEADGLLLQNSLHRVEGVRLREWDDALTIGELNEKYRRAEWLRQAEEEAITLHHEQRSRGTVPSYGQALAMATLMEQMHLEVRHPAESPPVVRPSPWSRSWSRCTWR